jgi:hypothetical protein
MLRQCLQLRSFSSMNGVTLKGQVPSLVCGCFQHLNVELLLALLFTFGLPLQTDLRHSKGADGLP